MQQSAHSVLLFRHFCSLCLLVSLATSSATGQTGANTGLAGWISDPAGAALPDVEVTLTQIETQQDRVVASQASGHWEARFLAPGPYRVSFEHPDYQGLTREGVTVTTAEITTLDVSLELGEVTISITVTTDAPMASYSSATLVRTLDRRELDELPTSSRNFTQLLVVEPGVSADLSDPLSNNNASISPSVNGARTTNNSFSFNSIDVTSLLCCNGRLYGDRGTIDEGGGTLSRNIAPAPETLAEVKLQTSLYDVSVGRNGGGNFQVVSKSGTNEYHGTAYHFFQNDKLIANDFFFNRAGLDRPVLRRNEAGFTLGGPVVKNRTFFFGSYQATRAKTSFVEQASNTLRVPKDLTDDRSDEGIHRFAEALGVKNASDLNPISKQLLQARFEDGSYLVPSGTNGGNCRQAATQVAQSCQVLSVIPALYRQDQFSTNIDHAFSQRHQISGKFFFANQPSTDPLAHPRALTRFEEAEITNQRTLSLTDVYVIGSKLINEFRAGFFRNRNDIAALPHFTNAEFGIQNPQAGLRADLAEIRIQARDVGQELRFGTIDDVTLDVQNTFFAGNTVSAIKGSHSIKVGAEFRRSQLNGDRQEDKNLKYRYRTWTDFLTVGVKDSRGRARQLDVVNTTYGETIRGFRMTDWALFVADDWKVAPNLTLNLGLRYDHMGFPWEVNGFLTTFDPSAALATGNLNDGFLFAPNFDERSIASSGNFEPRRATNKSLISPDWNNLAPRFGFAWTPRGSRFVVRGGYGIFHERMTGAFVNSLRRSVPFFREAEITKVGDWNRFPNDGALVPFPSFAVGFDEGQPQLESANSPGELFEAYETQVLDPDLATPYMQQWNLGIEWEIKPDYLLSVGYVGSKGTKLPQIRNTGQAFDVDAFGFLPRPGVPGGGFTGNYYQVVDGEFVNWTTPPPGCDVFNDFEECVIEAELRGALLGFDEDEGLNTLSTQGNSVYHSLQAGLEKRYGRSHMFNVNYTLSRSIDTFSDEGLFQVEHDQSRPSLNRGLSDFDRRHRLIMSWTWDIPWSRTWLLRGWSLSGIGTIQSGRPFSILDTEHSGFLFRSQTPRPNLAPAATHGDLATRGSLTSRVDRYLNPDALVHAGPQFGNLGRNTATSPRQTRLDVAASRLIHLTERTSLQVRAEFFNALNTPNFWRPESDLSSGSFGEITRTRGGPRVIQFGLKVRF